MLNISSKHFLLGFLSVLIVWKAQGQKLLTIKDAEQMALANYGTIKAKANQLNASKAYLTETKTEQLPDVNLSAQQDYGTVNGQNGPLYGYHGFNVASSGPTTGTQNWNAAFGALYLANVSWDFFSFGKATEKVKVQKTAVSRDETDLAQEQFQHEVRVASTYLNLLAAQQLEKASEDNLQRAVDLQKVVVARVKNGLNAGVDSSQANAEVSNARIAVTNSRQTVQDQSNQLAIYLGIPSQDFQLDSAFITKPPANVDPQSHVNIENHPILQFYQNRVNVSNELAKYYATFAYPTFSFFGTYQGRGSGFKSDYGTNATDYTGSYGSGVDPTRYNYLVGIGVIWNLTTPFRVHYQVKSQKYTSAQYKDEYDLVSQQLMNQQLLAETRISNALKNFNEVPEEVKAATDAYHQKYALYKNGLANIVDFTQALYVVNRAEVDKDIAQNNVWQAILFKAAATGDFGIFINNF
ncbi:TolC family protein [Mucilaginibacter sp. BJC16-A38]|uniref:TolC family protein n=1 Tax=Mucilaginibacter phenanthrenivorans TaxID=1234842 RepID=UPI0021584590|nr:TolC family protein [Mucilaginibacter phenanthrenivorans]MCR8560727.1 TolC family protein [Mucilaginibacter phenanthrenivorans]